MGKPFCAAFCISLFCAVLNVTAQETQAGNVNPIYKPLDIEGAQRKEVEPYRSAYLKPFGQKQLSAMLENAETYRLYIRAELKKREMPAVLEYLPVIESGYNPSARSKDGQGVGLWQFMPNSVAPFLTVSAWIDERLDPWKSTQAALSKLQANYAIFKDWPLAIGAYNCGAGAMQRALAKAQQKTYWYVAEQKLIPDHTIRYVPKLLAAADVAENAAYYNVAMPSAKNEDGNPINPRAGEFDYITVHSSFALRLLAAELRMDNELLENLNPALLYGITPPDSSYTLRLPPGMENAALHAVTIISKSGK